MRLPKKKQYRRTLHILSTLILFTLTSVMPSTAADTPWPIILEKARGQTVNWYMWGGFPTANAYVNGYVAPRVSELYGVKLRQVPVKDISEVVSKVLVEKRLRGPELTVGIEVACQLRIAGDRNLTCIL